MKFRNPDTGEIFNNLQQAADVFCLNYDSYCQGCPIDKANGGRACRDWIQEHPHEAARLMGYVEENKEENMVKELYRLALSTYGAQAQTMMVMAQMAILETEMVAIDQIILPYMVDDMGRTVYELYQSRQLLIGEVASG